MILKRILKVRRGTIKLQYSEDQLIELAKINPQKLVDILSDPNQNNVILTFGIEALTAECKDENLVLPVLKQLLKHRNALVREGTLIGVDQFYNDNFCNPDILTKVRDISKNDPHPGIKECAKAILEEFI